MRLPPWRALMWLVVAGLCAPSLAQAHKPFFAPDGNGAMDDPFPVGDPGVSIVVYRQVTCEYPQFWLSFDAAPGESLYLQMLTPEIDGLWDYRPALVLLGPGLPAVDVPFEVPEGLGGIVYDTSGVTEPPVFDEPFTMTRSWTLVEDTVAAMGSGTHYVVAFHPEGLTGKLAVAIGTREEFGIADFGMLPVWTEQVRTFHETDDYPPAVAVSVGQCAMDTDDPGDSLPSPASPAEDPQMPEPAIGEAQQGNSTPASLDGDGSEDDSTGAAGAGGGQPPFDADGTPDPGADEADRSAGGCSVATGGSSQPPIAMASLTLLALLRRRRI